MHLRALVPTSILLATAGCVAATPLTDPETSMSDAHAAETTDGGEPDSVVTADQVGDAPDASVADEGAPPDAGADVTGDAATTTTDCPTDLPGPALVEVPQQTGAAYCIDATEVTVGQYRTFLEDLPTPQTVTGEPAPCASNDSYLPLDFTNQNLGGDTLPIRGLSWCDAWAYCHWAGKHLCGTASGAGTAAWSTASHLWYNACSAGGAKPYPYGFTYDPQACNGADHASQAYLPVGTADCEGGYPGLFDMLGNVNEWLDVCDDDQDQCVTAGSAYVGPADQMTCTYGVWAFRTYQPAEAGVRCCLVQ